MKKISWEYYFARKFTAHRYEVVMKVFFSDFYKKYFDVCLRNMLVAPQDKNHVIYMNSAEWPEAQRKIFQAVCRDWPTFQKFKKMLQISQKRFYQVAKGTAGNISSKLGGPSLLKLFNKAMDCYQDFFNKPIWIIFPIEPLLSEEAERMLDDLVKRLGKTDKQQEYFDIIFSPEKKNAIVREREDLLTIAIAKKQGKPIEALLMSHVKKFGWIPCYDPADNPWDEEYFEGEIGKILSSSTLPERELAELQEKFRGRKKIFNDFLKSNPMAKRQKEIFQMAHEVCFIKDERDDYRRLGSFWLKPLFTEIGRRAGLSLRETANLLRDEIEEFLTTGRLPESNRIKERVGGYVLLRRNGKKIKIFSGQEGEAVMRQELGRESSVAQSVLKGTIGNKGMISGPVRVVITKHDLRKVEAGDVLVAVTTHPDFVPAMQRACAFVTDEGGITCHAAIVAREMKKPCIVGTKTATKVFKDGDLVEVDAERGIVRKLST